MRNELRQRLQNFVAWKRDPSLAPLAGCKRSICEMGMGGGVCFDCPLCDNPSKLVILETIWDAAGSLTPFLIRGDLDESSKSWCNSASE